MAKRVKESHSFDHQGGPTVMRIGTLVEDDDPRLKGRERYYEEADVAAARTSVTSVETATAEPGARRSVSKSLKESTR